MTIYTLIFCWYDEYNDGSVSTYSYSSLEKAVKSAGEVMSNCVVNHGGLKQRGKTITVKKFKELLKTYLWYENYISPENHFWVRIDVHELDK